MLPPLLTLGVSLFLGQVPEPIENMASKLSSSIVRARYERVGVIPRFTQREGEKETWNGSMGPQGEWLSEVFTGALVDAAKGRFQVVDNPTMAKAFGKLSLTPARLSDPAVLKEVAQETGGLDALIIGRSVDVREPAKPGAAAGKLVRSEITCNLIDVRSGELIGSAYRDLKITPSLAAYRGESSETGAYEPLAIDFSNPSEKGANTPNLPRPRRDGATALGTNESGSAPGPEGGEIPAIDDPRFPFPVQIIVDDMPREFIKVINPETGHREFYVNLEPGETYQIAVKNKTVRTVYGVVYVDGINLLGVRRDPESPRYWNMAPGQDCRFRGWYLGSGSDYKEVSLIVRPASDTIAIQKGGQKDGFADRLGEIQCIIFGTEEELKPEEGSKSMVLGRFGTGGGEVHDFKVREIVGPKRSENRLLTFVIHYAPMSQIKKLQIAKD